MKKVLFTLFFFVVVSFAQEFKVVSSQFFHPTTVNFTYTLPVDDPTVSPLVKAAEHDPVMAPAKIIWFWGDEVQGAKIRSFTEYAWKDGQKVSHLYTRPGIYGVTVVIVDAKNRSIRQAGFGFKLNPLFEEVK